MTKPRKDPAAHVSLSSDAIVKQQTQKGKHSPSPKAPSKSPRSAAPRKRLKRNLKSQSRRIASAKPPLAETKSAKRPTPSPPASQQGGTRLEIVPNSRRCIGRLSANAVGVRLYRQRLRRCQIVFAKESQSPAAPRFGLETMCGLRGGSPARRRRSATVSVEGTRRNRPRRPLRVARGSRRG